MFGIVIFVVSFALAASQAPGQCENACVSQNARNGALYKQMFQGTINQVDYTSICKDIQGVSTCLANCTAENGGSDCLTISMPIYTAACAVGYEQFSQLGQCYQTLNAQFSNTQQQCQQQCASETSAARRRRRQAVQNALVNGDTFCITNCGLAQELQTIQSQCPSWVAQFASTVSQTYNQLFQLSPTCLAL